MLYYQHKIILILKPEKLQHIKIKLVCGSELLDQTVKKKCTIRSNNNNIQM